MTVNDPELKDLVIGEVKNAFNAPNRWAYEFNVEAAVDTLFKLLRYDHGYRDFDAVGDQILDGLQLFDREFKLDSLPDRCEPFCKLVLQLVDPNRYDELTGEVDGQEKGPSFAPILKSLKLITNPALRAKHLDELMGHPRFAEHVMRTYMARNRVHDAPEYSRGEAALIFESVCVFLVFCVAEYRAELESVVRNTPAVRQLEKLRTRFGKWAVRHVPVAGQEQASDGFDAVDPQAVEYLWRDDEDMDESENEEEDPEDEFAEARSGRVIDLVDEMPQLVLLGDPGAGKTTTLQFVAWATADRIIRAPSCGESLPVYLELKHCSKVSGKSLEEMLSRELESYGYSINELDNERFRLLLDGLNEVANNQRTAVANAIQYLIERYEGLPLVISSRPGTYQNQFNCPTLLLQKFSDDQIRDFIKRVFSDPKSAADFTAVLKSHPRLWEWGRNPLSLKMIVEIGLRSDGNIPDNQGRLMEMFLAGLMDREAAQQTVQTDPYVKQRLLSSLAFETRSAGNVVFSFDEAVAYVVNEAEAISHPLNATAFLREVIDNNLLEETDADDLAFSHEMYQEFFAASELSKKGKADKKHTDTLIKSLNGDPFWEEPLILLSGLVEDRKAFIEQLSIQSPWVAAKSVTSAVATEPEIQKIVATAAGKQAEAPGVPEKDRAEALMALVELGEFHQFLIGVLQVDRFKKRKRLITVAFKKGNAGQVLGILETLANSDQYSEQSKGLWEIDTILSVQFKNTDPELQERLLLLAEKLYAAHQFKQVGLLLCAFHLQEYLIGEWPDQLIRTNDFKLEERFPIGELVDQLIRTNDMQLFTIAILLIEEYDLQDRFPIGGLIDQLLNQESVRSLGLAVAIIKRHNLQDKYPIRNLVDELINNDKLGTTKGESFHRLQLAIGLIEKYKLQDQYMIGTLLDDYDKNHPSKENSKKRDAKRIIKLIHKYNLLSQIPAEWSIKKLMLTGTIRNTAIANKLIKKYNLQDQTPIVTLRGKIKKLTDKGFGFITSVSGETVFFRFSKLEGVTYDELQEGEAVVMEVETGPKGRLRARRVRRGRAPLRHELEN